MKSTPERADSFSEYHIIKDGSFLVTRVETFDGPMVCKISKGNVAKLEKEINRIKSLREHYPLHRSLFPEIQGEGILDSGPYAGESFYLLPYIEGQVFSTYLQTTKDDEARIEQTITGVISTLLDLIGEHELDSKYDLSGGQWLKDRLESTLSDQRQIDLLGKINALDEVVINGKTYHSIGKCLNSLANMSVYGRLDEEKSFLSGLGHWNFHSDNIILHPDSPQAAFSIIDPDPSLDFGDPMFGIARLFYSFPHEVGDSDSYVIETDCCVASPNSSNEFTVKYKWPDDVLNNYKQLFTSLHAKSNYDPSQHDDRLGDPLLLARLDLNLLLCLMRGAIVNFSESGEVGGVEAGKIRNEGVYLLLVAIEFANNVTNRLLKLQS